MKRITLSLLGLLGIAVLGGVLLNGCGQPNVQAKTETAPGGALPAAGTRISLADGGALVYEFDHQPKLGTAILKVTAFDPAGKPSTAYRVELKSGMPEMRGAHDTEWTPMQVNDKGLYLAPLDFVMPGGWEINLRVSAAEKEVLNGAIAVEI